MSLTFEKFFYPSDVRPIPGKTIRTILQWLLLLRIVIVSILLGVSIILQTKTHALLVPSLQYVIYFIVAIYLFTILSAIAMKFISNYHRFAIIQTVGDALMAAFIVYSTGGSQSIFTVTYFLPIVSGSFILLRLGGLLMAAISTISYGFLLLVEFLHGHLYLRNIATPLSDPFVAMHFFAIHGIVFFITACLCVIVFERMRRTESALFQSNIDYDRLYLQYKQVFDDISTGIVTVDASGNISSINHSAELICGYTTRELIGQRFEQIFPGFIHHSEKNQLRQLAEISKKNGAKIPVGYSWGKLNLPNYEDCRVYTMQDLSQIRAMEKQVKQAEKMATIGGMAAGIAHEFRNPLAAISGAAQILNDETLSLSGRKLVDIISRESTRLEGTIDDFLLFSRPAEPDRKWFSLKLLTEETIDLLQQSRNWPSNNCRTVTYVSANLDCWGDPRQIQQVLMNLISNACQAMVEQGGEIEISAEIVAEKHQENLLIRVTDNAGGIEESIRESIFEPFFTTRENGTGLGLAIVRQLVESHNGKVSVESLFGKGSTFTIILPLPQQ
ncbi:MAG: PAS domain S-box protein [Desulfobulbaceae bacterium]|nr:PAS domain S-box protein [Desulfobulbaceae bacterium]